MRSESRNLIAFVVPAFAWSWLFWTPRVLEASGFNGVPRLPNVGAFGPTVAAFVLVYLTSGGGGVVALAKRAVDADFRAWWFLPILLLFPAINGASSSSDS